MIDISVETAEEKEAFDLLATLRRNEADLRWSAVLEMVDVAKLSSTQSLTDICARLHDAGYRKGASAA